MKAALMMALSMFRAIVTYVLVIAIASLVRMNSSLVFGRLRSFLVVSCVCVLWLSYSSWYFNKVRLMLCGQCLGMRIAMWGVMLITLLSDVLLVLSAGCVIYLCFF